MALGPLTAGMRLTIRRAVGPLRRRTGMRLRPHLYKETYINAALPRDREATYLEIGVRDGDSFRAIQAGRKIGVDPDRTPRMWTLRHGEEFFQMTSDEFFAAHAPGVLKERTIDVALVDGLHQFRQALKDVLNVEPYMAQSGLIVLDDSNPPTREQASTEQCEGNWNGDVWKVMALLRAERADLACVTVDADQGVGLVSGFGQPHTAIAESAILRAEAMDYEVLAADREAIIGLRPPPDVPEAARVRGGRPGRQP